MDPDGPLLTDTGSGLTVRYRGRNLYSLVDPRGSAARRARAVPLSEATLYLVPSPLLFYGVGELLGTLPRGAHLLCVENDQQLMRLSVDRAPRSLIEDERLTYVRADSVNGVLLKLRELGTGRFRRCREIVLNGGRSLSARWYASVFDMVQFEIQSYWRNRITRVHMAHLWVKNLFLNLPHLVGASDLQALATDLPVVVAGAGESLEATIPLLKEVRGSIYLLAVDTAVLSLRSHGLDPDAVVVLESQIANLSDFIGIDGGKEIGAIDLTSHPECVRRFPARRRRFFVSRFAEIDLFSRLESFGLLPTLVPPLGSVGIAALYCALSMSKAPIMYSGLDFAYRAGKPHARGAPSHQWLLASATRLHPDALLNAGLSHPHRKVAGKGGAQLWTHSGLSSYVKSLTLLASGTDRLNDLGMTGLPSGAHLVAGREELHGLIERSCAEAGRSDNPGDTATVQGGSYTREMVESFLLAERDLHRRLAAAGTRLLRELADTVHVPAGKSADDFRGALKAVEYVRLHFPDDPDEISFSEGFVKRVLEASDTCVRWIERAVKLLAAGG